jgi:hypothetical protein
VNAFETRIKLLEKWAPSLLPNLKDMDDLAEIIYEVWNEAEAHTEERIIKLLDFYRQKPDMNWAVVIKQVKQENVNNNGQKGP